MAIAISIKRTTQNKIKFRKDGKQERNEKLVERI
jgi:hypothetical protein